jgi:FkbM family methyltransferase
MSLDGVVHAGAHKAEEADIYLQNGIRAVLWIEANPLLMDDLEKTVSPLNQRSLHACLGAKSGELITLNLANNGQCSSILPLGTHREKHPEVCYVDEVTLPTMTLFDAIQQGWGRSNAPPYDKFPNFLNIDLQGAELLALKGLVEPWPMIRQVDYIYTEINEDPLYCGCALLPELTEWLATWGFKMVRKVMAGRQTRNGSDRDGPWLGWGDALFVHERKL